MLAVAAFGTLAFASTASAAVMVTVTPSTSSWTQDDTRPGGNVTWTNQYGAPPGLGRGSLKLTTNLTTAAKAGLYTHTMAGFPVRYVFALSYWTYQAATVPPNPVHAAASYQFQIDINGSATGGFTTLVYEPYQNGLVQPTTWQRWDVDAGSFWSSRTVADGTCAFLAGGGGPPFYTLAQIKMMCPNAVVVGIGVNVGSNNPGYTVATDGVQFNPVIYNFELGNRRH
jgi:hypothetical protein